jgi:methionyl-tRNA formyltransferase
LKADLQVVVAFRMLPEIVWNMPPMGTINLHGSLLPQYRGAAPIHWAVINGETQTGVTTFKLQHAIDTGDILLQDSFPIGPDETTGDVHDKMKTIGAALLVKTIAGLAEGSIAEKKQDQPSDANRLNHAPKIFTETCQVNWQKPVQEIHNFIRGLSPFPGALSTLDGKILKIYRSQLEIAVKDQDCGTVLSDGKTFLKIAAADGFIHLLDLQLEGKKRMLVEDFLRGYRVNSM